MWFIVPIAEDIFSRVNKKQIEVKYQVKTTNN
jgi:hypothetical protein